MKHHQKNPCSGSPPVYQDLSMRHDWPVKKAIVDLPISMKGNSNRTCGNSLSPLWAQNKDLGSTSQKSLTEVNYVCPSPFLFPTLQPFCFPKCFPAFNIKDGYCKKYCSTHSREQYILPLQEVDSAIRQINHHSVNKHNLFPSYLSTG